MTAPSDGGFNTPERYVQSKLGEQDFREKAAQRTRGLFSASGLVFSDTVSRVSDPSGPTEVHTMDETTDDGRSIETDDEAYTGCKAAGERGGDR